MEKPTPTDKEIKLNPKKHIVSKTDEKGVITYGNDYFVEISGYKEAELIGQPHSIIRHPDMPKAVFKLMWDTISQKKNMFAVVKNLSKDGSYYWVVTDFTPKVDTISGEIKSYTAFRQAASQKAIDVIEPLYAKLLEIEEVSGVQASTEYLEGLLEEKGQTYEEFINDVIGNKGLFKIFFAAMKKLFG